MTQGKAYDGPGPATVVLVPSTPPERTCVKVMLLLGSVMPALATSWFCNCTVTEPNPAEQPAGPTVSETLTADVVLGASWAAPRRGLWWFICRSKIPSWSCADPQK